MTGFVIDETENEPGFKTREIIRVFDDTPIFDKTLLEFYKWIADYYIVPLGLVLRMIIPKARGSMSLTFIRLKKGWEKNIDSVPEGLNDIIEILKRKPHSLRRLNKIPGAKTKIKKLEELSLIERYDRFVTYFSKRGRNIDWFHNIKEENLSLTTEQNDCVEKVLNSFRVREFKTFLLWGPPGSGKTEVY